MKLCFDRLVSLLLFMSILLASIIVSDHYAHAIGEPLATVRFVPSLIVVETVGQEFTVACVVEEAYNLTALDIEISWNLTCLAYVKHSATIPNEDFPEPQTVSPYGGILHGPILWLANSANVSTGTYNVACLTLKGPSFNGSGTVFLITFEVLHVPLGSEVQPLDYLDTYLQFESISLARSPSASPGSIDYNTVDGQVRILAKNVPHHDVSIVAISTPKTGGYPLPTIAQGQTAEVIVTTQNQGNFTETFSVTVAVEATIIYAKTDVTLAQGETTTFEAAWDASNWPKGSYCIVATLDGLQSEADTADNTLAEGPVLITIPGDIDGDRRVDIFDVVRMAGIHLTSRPNSKYDPNSDLNDDGTIDSYDILVAVRNYGESW